MYMRNNRYEKYNIDGFPPNYSGQYANETLSRDGGGETDRAGKPGEQDPLLSHKPPPAVRDESPAAEHRETTDRSLFGNLFGGRRDGRKGGLLAGFFNKGENAGDGGILSRIELEDLILLAVIFFLLKDGFDDDLILILAIILFSS